jgi:hypothetical protein
MTAKPVENGGGYVALQVSWMRVSGGVALVEGKVGWLVS